MSIPRYIERLRLAGPAPEPRPAARLKAFRDTTRSVGAPPPAQPIPEGLQAAVNAGSLLSFVQGVDEQERSDILYSMQLAQRGASGTYDRFTQTQSWYQHYIEILENLGWVAEQLAFAVHRQSEGELRMDKAALAIIAAIATQNQLAVLKEAVTALEGLAGDDDALRLFDFHSSTQMSGNFQIGAVQKADNGALALALGAFYFRSVDARRRFLFFSWGARQVHFWTAAQKMTFNTTLYAPLRDTVQRKLGVSAADFIARLALG